MPERSAASHGALFAACFCAWLHAEPAHADPFHHQPLPIGERALGMGGAFTGLANEPSAAYYNPAGLVRFDDTTLSAGVTLIAFDRVSVRDGYRTSVGNTDLTHNARPSLPVFVTLVRKLGRRDAEGRRRHAVALSTFTLDERRLDFDVKVEGADAGRGVVDTLFVQQEHSTLLHGASYAYRFSDELSFGLTGSLALTRMSHIEERLTLTLGEANGDQSFQMPTVDLDSRRTSSDVKNIVTRAGVLYVKSRLRLGLMLQPPSLQVAGSAKVRDRKVVADSMTAEPFGTFFDDAQDGLSAEAPLPWEVRLGLSYEPYPGLTVAADGSLYGKNGTAKEPVVAIGARKQSSDEGERPQATRAGEFVVERYQRRMTGNASLGIEYVIWDALVFRTGFFTDLSAAPAVPKRSDRYLPNDVHRFGTTFSVGYISNGYDVSLGGAARFGRGQGLAYIVGETDEPYVRTSVRERTFYVFITGIRRVVTKLAKITVEKIENPDPKPVQLLPEATAVEEPPAAVP